MYKAVKAEGYLLDWHEQRDKAAGVMGVLVRHDSASIPADAALEGVLYASESRDEAEIHAKAYCFDYPDKSVYLCDGEHRVVRLVGLHILSEAKNAQAAHEWFVIGLVGVFVLNIVVASAVVFFKYDRAVLLLLAAVAGPVLAYAGLVKWKIMNEIESIHLAIVLSLFVWATLVALR